MTLSLWGLQSRVEQISNSYYSTSNPDQPLLYKKITRATSSRDNAARVRDPTRNRTGIARSRIRSANHYTIEPTPDPASCNLNSVAKEKSHNGFRH
jgi:hypothetical protein